MKESVSAIILAGGQGARMNFKNKGLLSMQGKSLIEHVIERLKDQVDDIIISANNNLAEYRALGFTVVTDESKSVGPLSGMYAGAFVAKHPLVLVVPCDMPYLPKNLVSTLGPHLNARAISIFAHDRVQPLVSLIEREALKGIKHYLDDGGRSVMGWLEEINAGVLNWDTAEQKAFQNINSLAELAALEQDG
tara:strand:- start:5740 stop:6315 length:576 start_codon:yes stop_codon:yes gene_type:complete